MGADMDRAWPRFTVVLLFAAVCGASAGDEPTLRVPPPVGGRCEPALPMLSHSLPTAAAGHGVSSCEVITTPGAWDAFCSAQGIACDALGSSFFTDWTVVALVVDTMSPVLCENAGPVPAWRLACLSRRGALIRARVEVTTAGAECRCAMTPQFPVRLILADAIPAGWAATCRPWTESHLVECLGP
jgi:hypothetical protein